MLQVNLERADSFDISAAIREIELKRQNTTAVRDDANVMSAAAAPQVII